MSFRVSDADRDRAVLFLREHCSAGRLDSDEFDERVAEALSARTDDDLRHAVRELPALPAPPRPDTSAATTSLILGLVGAGLFVCSIGFFSLLTLPISGTAWVMGRKAHRRGLGPQARAGMILGIVVTVLSVLWLGGCSTVLL